MKQVLTIAGSDSGGGAGIQADIKTFQELDVFGTSVITAVTAQNTRGVIDVAPVPIENIEKQLQAVGDDFDIAAVKTGMLFDAVTIRTVADSIKHYNWQRLVVDPVMIAKGGASLLKEEAKDSLIKHLLPLATLVTPNIPEAEALSGIQIYNEQTRRMAAEQILKSGAQGVLIKGGHGADPDFTEDFYLDQHGGSLVLRSSRIQTKHTHGTGCTFSAALAAEFAKGKSIEEAFLTAKQFIQSAIEHSLNIGAGHGPTNHSAYRHYAQKEMIRYVH
ncbi:bifunctional hydroxymethylpyrimidine kinase/phosphomethylpyrimidine kinase [Jeotgalibacillus haloalkalitolerans]|uniref:Hydroxymethylpyrimidine/phosphomethylpyrimidine kinase n=1 Tax=Jeotgalibacillus haloalkalitolerans TaxID=3104292 RepID=A0ABU5KPE9_9BACL|nr:bifunctional hydroxymethylpyrimidine kinase/phosphomethylpyrimidine kinase [Jeotgalibacillus sp. HH7-29]MDZ5712841.1 bifunctional hydroxymethylpyrimidine kinase/phosphomethylpyrimidine kinase [Jeotgalibacillus sp. HH7-29]